MRMAVVMKMVRMRMKIEGRNKKEQAPRRTATLSSWSSKHQISIHLAVMKMIQFKSIPTSPLLLCYQLQNWKQDGQHLSVLFHKGPPHSPQKWILMLWGRLKVHKAQVSLQYVIFTSYLHNQSTLEHNLNRFRKLQFRATTFIVDLFLEFGHVTTLPMTYWLDSDRYNHLYVLFLHLLVGKHQYFPFWTSTPGPECITQQYCPALLFFFSDSFRIIPVFHLEMQMFPYLEMHVGPWKQCPPSIITNPSLFFFCISLPFFIQKSIVFHIWKCALDPETIPIHHDNHPYTFFPKFSLSSWYFSFSIATLYMFGNVCWILNTMPNMVTNHPPFFLRFFRCFIAIFHSA